MFYLHTPTKTLKLAIFINLLAHYAKGTLSQYRFNRINIEFQRALQLSRHFSHRSLALLFSFDIKVLSLWC